MRVYGIWTWPGSLPCPPPSNQHYIMKALFQMNVTKKMGVPSPFSCQSRDINLSWEEQVTYLSRSPYPHLHVADALVEVRVDETTGVPFPSVLSLRLGLCPRYNMPRILQFWFLFCLVAFRVVSCLEGQAEETRGYHLLLCLLTE